MSLLGTVLARLSYTTLRELKLSRGFDLIVVLSICPPVFGKLRHDHSRIGDFDAEAVVLAQIY